MYYYLIVNFGDQKGLDTIIWYAYSFYLGFMLIQIHVNRSFKVIHIIYYSVRSPMQSGGSPAADPHQCKLLPDPDRHCTPSLYCMLTLGCVLDLNGNVRSRVRLDL